MITESLLLFLLICFFCLIMTFGFSAHIDWSASILRKVLLLLLLNSQTGFVKYYISAVNYTSFDWVIEPVSFTDIFVTKKDTLSHFLPDHIPRDTVLMTTYLTLSAASLTSQWITLSMQSWDIVNTHKGGY